VIKLCTILVKLQLLNIMKFSRKPGKGVGCKMVVWPSAPCIDNNKNSVRHCCHHVPPFLIQYRPWFFT
jgi:hypothetical protein